jgi:UDP-N-acetylglucosamine acyltransferase
MNNLHQTVIIEGDVKLGENNTILPYTSLIGPLEIGNNNIIGPNAVIGSPGQDTRNPRYDSKNAKIQIGNNNIIREFTAIQKPCYKDITSLGDDIYLMQSVHISHDTIIQDKVVITPMVVLGGITKILTGANLALGVTINQYCVIGQYSIVGAGAAAVKNVKPFSRYIPGKPISVNEYAIKKYGFEEYLDEIKEYVLYNLQPKSKKIVSIIEEFNSLHELSKCSLY